MTRRQTATIVFIVLCVVLVAAAVSLNIGWILVNGRRVAPLILGVISFSLIIAGLIVYTVFLVREMRITEQQDSFLNSVTHELKTPIASIRLYLETLQSREVGEAQRKEFYAIMLADADRLQQTVEQVLKAGATRHQRHALQRMPIDVSWLTEECVETTRLRHHLAPGSIVMDVEATEQPIVVEGDVDDLRTALGNLVDNAVKYSAGRPRIAVHVAAPSPETVWVRVKDQGIGIPKPQQSRIFNRFYRFQAAGGKVKGTGLGLFIVRSIAKRHGGKVFVQSEGEGMGSTFTLELPRSPDSRLPTPDSRGTS
jgi:two-component system, OmpR family, sensor histidine kinase SenX3